MITFLTNLEPGQWVAIVAGSWICASCVIAVPIGRFMRVGDDTRLPTYPPPVPPPLPFEDDCSWIADLPVDCLSDAEVSVLFDDLVDLGGLR